MMILCVPMYSKQELNADSNYVVYSSLIRAMAEVRPSWHWIVVFPDAKSGFKYQDDGFFDLPNVTRVPQRISPRKMANAISFDGAYYDTIMRKIGIDAVWCNLPEIAGHVRQASAGLYEKSQIPMTIAAHNYVIHHTLPYPIDSMENVLLAQLTGALGSDCHVFDSDYCREMFFENAGKYLSAEMVDRLQATAARVDYGVLDPDEMPMRDEPNDVPVIAYNHRLQGYKNFKTTFGILADLHAEGIAFRVRYMNNTTEKTATIRHHPFVEIRMCANRSEYLDALRGCDLNVTNSQHETFCIAAVESMAFGQPIIAPDAMTFPQITGKAAGNAYPFLFKNETEQRDHLRTLLIDAGKRRKWGGIVRDHVLQNYNRKLWAERYAALFEEQIKPFEKFGAPDDTLQMFRDRLKENHGGGIHEFRARVYASKVGGRQPFSNQSCPMTKLTRLVRHVGGRVEMRGGKQYVYAP